MWATIAAYGLPWAFIVEDDFTAERSIDLAAMQQVMDDRPGLVQMALRRQAWSAPELEAGGVIEQHPDDYTDLPTHPSTAGSSRRTRASSAAAHRDAVAEELRQRSAVHPCRVRRP